MNAFLTGSHVYGTPHDESDVDLVVRIDQKTYDKLCELAGVPHNHRPLRFGDLNLVVCLDDAEYAAWKAGTETLLEDVRAGRGPATRTGACNLFDKIRTWMGIPTHARDS